MSFLPILRIYIQLHAYPDDVSSSKPTKATGLGMDAEAKTDFTKS